MKTYRAFGISMLILAITALGAHLEPQGTFAIAWAGGCAAMSLFKDLTQ